MIGVQRAISSTTKRCVFSGVESGSGSNPDASKLRRTASSPITACVARATGSMIARRAGGSEQSDEVLRDTALQTHSDNGDNVVHSGGPQRWLRCKKLLLSPAPAP